ncbi:MULTISPECIES: class I SAM-dependent methyltransferase [unclassified Roseovarius]|uniref:class I SAM-dependent methyltransferase n=1 Tax=unclassified Roseovarius TaxID=2614913 RepID=UPI00273FC390|nr:class I SAM-dependent methyltransferase [Roseovarius sp. MMSF_3350]
MTRQGPGTSEDVRWALSQLDLPDAPHVIDAACGPGADLVTLAECLPRARIEGIDQLPHLVEEARVATARFTNVTVATGDMAQISGFYDLIWCAGALYFLGVTEGLTLWKRALTTDGAVAFSEPVLAPHAPEAARDFWADYTAISDLDGITARVEAAGYEVLNHRLITGMAWADYYAELGGRIATLRPGADAALTGVLDAAAREITLWRQAPGDIAYALILARPGFGAT